MYRKNCIYCQQAIKKRMRTKIFCSITCLRRSNELKPKIIYCAAAGMSVDFISEMYGVTKEFVIDRVEKSLAHIELEVSKMPPRDKLPVPYETGPEVPIVADPREWLYGYKGLTDRQLRFSIGKPKTGPLKLITTYNSPEDETVGSAYNNIKRNERKRDYKQT